MVKNVIVSRPVWEAYCDAYLLVSEIAKTGDRGALLIRQHQEAQRIVEAVEGHLHVE